MNLEKEIEKAKGFNWARIICQKCDRIAQERAGDIGAMVDLLNGKIYQQAQEEFALELQSGLYDSMLMLKENNK